MLFVVTLHTSGCTGVFVRGLLIDCSHYFPLWMAFFFIGHFEELGSLWIVWTCVCCQKPKPHGDEAELSTCEEKKQNLERDKWERQF